MELKKIKYIHTISQSNQRKGVKKITQMEFIKNSVFIRMQ